MTRGMQHEDTWTSNLPGAVGIVPLVFLLPGPGLVGAGTYTGPGIPAVAGAAAQSWRVMRIGAGSIQAG